MVTAFMVLLEVQVLLVVRIRSLHSGGRSTLLAHLSLLSGRSRPSARSGRTGNENHGCSRSTDEDETEDVSRAVRIRRTGRGLPSKCKSQIWTQNLDQKQALKCVHCGIKHSYEDAFDWI